MLRFFRPALAPANLTNPIVYETTSTALKKIWIAPDLSKLQVYCHHSETDMKKIQLALKTARNDLPCHLSLTVENGVFHMGQFYDICLKLSSMINEIKVTDPSYFTRLDSYMENLDSDEKDLTTSMPDYFMSSPLHATYFCLQGMRGTGMQHTIEVPLKSLRTNNLISQWDLKQIVLQVWPRISHLRRVNEKSLLKLPESMEVPYVFSPHK